MLVEDDIILEGVVKNITEFGYDVENDNSDSTKHITIGNVLCELGVCKHPEHVN